MSTEDTPTIQGQDIRRIPTKNYVSSYPIAKSLADNAVRSWEKMWELIRRCQLHIQGERPVPFAKLKNRGLDWTSNENFLKATAKIQKLTAASVAEIFKSISLSYVTFRDYDEKTDNNNACQYLKDEGTRSICAMAFGYAFATTLMREQRLADFLNRTEYPSTAYGFVSLLSKEDDWVPEVIHPLDIAFRPRTKPDELDTFVVFQTVSAKTLWSKWEQKVRNTKKSKNWQKNGLEEVLWRAFRGHEKNYKAVLGQEWSDVLAKYNTCPSTAIQNTEDITIAKIYYKELDGTFTVVYIPYSDSRDPDKNAYASNAQNAVDARIFIKNFSSSSRGGKLKLIRETGYTETTFIEDLRGAAKFAVMDSIRYNATRNSTADKVKLAGSPFFDGGNNQTAAAFKLSVGSAFVIMPNNFSASANQPKFDIQTSLAYLQFEQGQYLRETEHIDADLQGRLSNRPNKAEVQAKAAEVNSLNTSKDVIKFSDYSHVFFDMMKAFVEASFPTDSQAKQGQDNFFKQVKKQLAKYIKTDDDVRDLIKAIDHFELLPVLGDKETIMMAISMAQTPYGRNRYQRMLLVSQGMPIEEVNNCVPLITDKVFEFRDARDATIENDTFWNSIDMLPFGTDDHVVHLETHLPKAQQVAEGFKAGRLQPQVAFAYMTNILYHIQIHLDLLGRDPVLNAKAQEYIPIFNDLQQSKNQMMLAAKAQQEAQANQQQKADKDAAEIQRKDAESQHKMLRKDELQQQKTQQTYTKIETDAALDRYKIDKEAENKKHETDLKNGNEITIAPSDVS